MLPDKIPETSNSPKTLKSEKEAVTEIKEVKKEAKISSEFVKGMSQLSQIGITIIVCVLIGVFAGRFLDNLFNTTPWLLLVFSFLGAGAAFKYLYDLTKRM